MAAKKSINLLPQGVGKNKVSKNLKKARYFSYVSIFIYFVAVSVGFGSQIYFSRNLNQIESQNEELKNSIRSLEETEYRLILTKDRIGKIEQIIDKRFAEKIFLNQKKIIDNLPDDVRLSNLKIDSKNATIELIATNSRDLVTFMRVLLELPEINSVRLEDFTFNPASGYFVTLEIT